MRRLTRSLALAAAATFAAPDAAAFCGFYVAQADTKLFNQASKVVLVRDGDKTVLTMANDYQGALKEFAIVVPVPQVITKDMVKAGDKALIDRVDAWSAPRLVEYHDDDPCEPPMRKMRSAAPMPAMAKGGGGGGGARARSLGVTIEERYTVGEYDILVLSAKQSDGLATWLKENRYRIPDGAEAVLGSYIKQDMKFFVAKVNLQEQDRLGFGYLRPLQVSYTSPKFMLPIRLGTVNANGPQDLIVFALTRKGRVETTNYRTVRIPSNVNIPEGTKDVFGAFYKAMFAKQVEQEDMRAVFLEHAWDMGWCDPCAANPLTSDELKGLGVWWIDGAPSSSPSSPMPSMPPMRGRRPMPMGGGAQDAYLTRLHVRYDAAHFPEDLVFQETQDRSNFQGRYVMQHAFKGEMDCAAAKPYLEAVKLRQAEEMKTLTALTGWADLSQAPSSSSSSSSSSPTTTPEAPPPAPTPAPAPEAPKKSWWQRLFGD
jgi:hypothetical protein